MEMMALIFPMLVQACYAHHYAEKCPIYAEKTSSKCSFLCIELCSKGPFMPNSMLAWRIRKPTIILLFLALLPHFLLFLRPLLSQYVSILSNAAVDPSVQQ